MFFRFLFCNFCNENQKRCFSISFRRINSSYPSLSALFYLAFNNTYNGVFLALFLTTLRDFVLLLILTWLKELFASLKKQTNKIDTIFTIVCTTNNFLCSVWVMSSLLRQQCPFDTRHKELRFYFTDRHLKDVRIRREKNFEHYLCRIKI